MSVVFLAGGLALLLILSINKQTDAAYNRYVRKFPNKQFLNLLGYELVDYNYLIQSC